MKTFTFDASCAAEIIVEAKDEAAARVIAEVALDDFTVHYEPLSGLKDLTISYHSDDSIELMDEENES